MQFLVIGRDDTDDEALMRRNDARAAHLELSVRMMREGNSLFGAAILDDAGTMAGRRVEDLQRRRNESRAAFPRQVGPLTGLSKR